MERKSKTPSKPSKLPYSLVLLTLLATPTHTTPIHAALTHTTPHHAPPSPGACECALFLVTSSEQSPVHRVFSTGEHYPVNCSLSDGEVDRQCGDYCRQESANIEEVFQLHPEAYQLFPPTAPCPLLPAPTAPHYTACELGWTRLDTPSYRHVCCHPEHQTAVWCDALPPTDQVYFAGEEESRGLDLSVDANDVINNEISSSGSTKPAKWKPTKEESESYLRTVLKYFGYSSVSEVVKNFDIFSLPQLFRDGVKTYRDEVNMGQCYMEFTTYSLFTKGENPFAMLTSRSKRALDTALEDPAYDGFNETLKDVQNFIKENLRRIGGSSVEEDCKDCSSRESKQAQIETIKSLVGSLVSMLRQTPVTQRYASVIEQLLPVVTSVYAAEDPQAAVNTLVTSVLGPYLDTMHGGNTKKKADILQDKKDRTKIKTIKGDQPQKPAQTSTSPLTAMALNLFRQYMGTYFNSLPGDVPNKHSDQPSSTYQKPAASTALSSNLLNMFNLFMGGGGKPRPSRPASRPTNTKIDAVDKLSQDKIDDLTKAEAARPKDFVDVILEVIRPVFISILGKAPGESGVSTIREISRLSVLGRVDDDIAQEVLSPFFCIKTYGINKAWTLTETSLRSFVKELSPQEKETVRALFL